MFYLANFSSYAWSLIVTDYVWQADEPRELIASDVLDSILSADDASETIADWIDDATQTLQEALQTEVPDMLASMSQPTPRSPVVSTNPPSGKWVVAGHHLVTALNVMADPYAERMADTAAQDDPELLHLRRRDRLPMTRRSSEGLYNGLPV